MPKRCQLQATTNLCKTIQKMAVSWKCCVLLLLMAVSAAKSDDDLQFNLLDDEPTHLGAYASDSDLYDTRVPALRKPHFYFGVFQAERLSDKENCTPRGIDDFPPDMFTLWQREHGAIILHFFFILYSMVIICNVVDDFFVPSLDILANGNCSRFQAHRNYCELATFQRLWRLTS